MAKVTKKEIEKVKELTKQANAKVKLAKIEAETQKAIAEAKAETAKRRKPSDRPRSFFVRTYIPIDDLRTFMRSARWVHHYAMCLHDKDVYSAEDEKSDLKKKAGSPKTPHTHIVLYTYDGKTASSVQKLFDRYAKSLCPDKPEGTRVEIPTSVTSAYRYLRHLDDLDKYQYTEKDVISDDSVYWVKHDITDGMNGVENKGYLMVEDILKGVPEREMNIRYGKEYIYHAQHLHASADRIRYEEQKVDVTPALLDYLLECSPYYKVDIIKFKEIFAYLKNVISKDMDNERVFDQFIEKELNNNG